jgi:hypothetical protein
MIGKGCQGQASDFVEVQPIGRPTYCCSASYIGVVVFFLGFSLFIDERKIKYVFLTGAITALIIWGKKTLS